MELSEYEKRFRETEDLKIKLDIANKLCAEFDFRQPEQLLLPYYQFISINAHFPDTELMRGKALLWLGNYYYQNSFFDMGLEVLYEAKEIFNELKELQLWTDTMNMIAVIYNALMQKDKALQVYEEVFKVNPNEPVIIQNYADLLMYKRDFDKAYHLIEKALLLIGKGNKNKHADVLTSLSNYYIQIHEEEKAIEIFEANKELILNDSQIRTKCFHLINHAEALLALKRIDEAIESIEMAVKIAEESSKLELLYFSYNFAAMVYEAKGNQEQCIKYLKKFMELKDKMYTFQIKEKTEALEARVEKEKRLAESQELVDKAKHMASIGIMASGITHEINQPLNAIMIDAQTLIYKDDIDKILPESYRQRIQYIIEATERISNIIKHIRSYWIKNDWIEKKDFEVNQTITKAVALVNQQVKAHGIILKVRLSPASVFIFGTPISLEQIIINLVVNSIHALDNLEQKQKIITLTSIVKGDIVNIYIQDNGPGIAKHIVNRIFEPFFTQKNKDLGSGLGLTLVQNFVKDLNGSITLIDEKKKGAHFVVKIPIIDKQ